MTKEETKLWLKSCLHKKQEAEQIEEAIKRLEAEMYNPKTAKLDKLPGSSCGAGSPTERLAIKHIDLLDRYQEKLADLRAEQLRVEEAIETLEPVERMLMRYRYLDGMTWEEVAVAISYSWKQMHRIHGRALDKLSTPPAVIPDDGELDGFEYGDDERGPY